AELGIPAWDILAKSIGKSVPEAMKMAEKGAIPAAKAIEGLIAGMNERFPDMMAKQSASLMGMWSTLQDNATQALTKIGEDIVTTFDLKAKMAGAIEALDSLNKALQELGTGGALAKVFSPEVQAAAITIAGAIAGALVPALAAMAGALVSAAIAIAPFALAGAAVAALGVALYQNWEPFQALLGGLGGVLQSYVIPAFGALMSGNFGEAFRRISDGAEIAWVLIQDAFSGFGPWLMEKAGEIASKAGQWAEAFMGWIGPMIPGFLARLGQLKDRFFSWVGDQAPPLLARFGAWVQSVIDWIIPAIPKMINKLNEMSNKMFDWIADNGSPIAEKFGQWVTYAVAWIAKTAVELLKEMPKILAAVAKWVADNYGKIYSLGIQFGLAFLKGVGDALSDLGPTLNKSIGGPSLTWDDKPLATAGEGISRFSKQLGSAALTQKELRGAVEKTAPAVDSLSESINGMAAELERNARAAKLTSGTLSDVSEVSDQVAQGLANAEAKARDTANTLAPPGGGSGGGGGGLAGAAEKAKTKLEELDLSAGSVAKAMDLLGYGLQQQVSIITALGGKLTDVEPKIRDVDASERQLVAAFIAGGMAADKARAEVARLLEVIAKRHLLEDLKMSLQDLKGALDAIRMPTSEQAAIFVALGGAAEDADPKIYGLNLSIRQLTASLAAAGREPGLAAQIIAMQEAKKAEEEAKKAAQELEAAQSALTSAQSAQRAETERQQNAFQKLADTVMGPVKGAFDLLFSTLNGGFGAGTISALGATMGTLLSVGGRLATTAAGVHIPMLASGTSNHPGGLAVVGEQGPELVNLPAGSSVTPNNKYRALSAGSSGGAGPDLAAIKAATQATEAATAALKAATDALDHQRRDLTEKYAGGWDVVNSRLDTARQNLVGVALAMKQGDESASGAARMLTMGAEAMTALHNSGEDTSNALGLIHNSLDSLSGSLGKLSGPDLAAAGALMDAMRGLEADFRAGKISADQFQAGIDKLSPGLKMLTDKADAAAAKVKALAAARADATATRLEKVISDGGHVGASDVEAALREVKHGEWVADLKASLRKTLAEDGDATPILAELEKVAERARTLELGKAVSSSLIAGLKTTGTVTLDSLNEAVDKAKRGQWAKSLESGIEKTLTDGIAAGLSPEKLLELVGPGLAALKEATAKTLAELNVEAGAQMAKDTAARNAEIAAATAADFKNQIERAGGTNYSVGKTLPQATREWERANAEAKRIGDNLVAVANVQGQAFAAAAARTEEAQKSMASAAAALGPTAIDLKRALGAGLRVDVMIDAFNQQLNYAMQHGQRGRSFADLLNSQLANRDDPSAGRGGEWVTPNYGEGYAPSPAEAAGHFQSYDVGGTVSGQRGQPQMAVVHGQEYVLKPGQKDNIEALLSELIAVVREGMTLDGRRVSQGLSPYLGDAGTNASRFGGGTGY
ncbi:MAG: hypothetical protein NTZ05_07185, partial [Chloroflexi bacterium]|nr:hypothetical protein [Chloroflexota bacterium]